MINLRKLKTLFRPTHELLGLTPLTERNVSFFEAEYDDGMDQFERTRDIQISQWLQLLP